MKATMFAALALTVLAGFPAFAAKTRTFTIPLDAGVTSITVEVSGNGQICGPARVSDSNGRVLVALAAGHCASTDR